MKTKGSRRVSCELIILWFVRGDLNEGIGWSTFDGDKVSDVIFVYIRGEMMSRHLSRKKREKF